jgi:hypothetical protein
MRDLHFQVPTIGIFWDKTIVVTFGCPFRRPHASPFPTVSLSRRPTTTTTMAAMHAHRFVREETVKIERPTLQTT